MNSKTSIQSTFAALALGIKLKIILSRLFLFAHPRRGFLDLKHIALVMRATSSQDVTGSPLFDCYKSVISCPRAEVTHPAAPTHYLMHQGLTGYQSLVTPPVPDLDYGAQTRPRRIPRPPHRFASGNDQVQCSVSTQTSGLTSILSSSSPTTSITESASSSKGM